MATSKLDIYNQALFNIGHTKRVQSPTETSAERQNCEAIYEPRKRTLIGMAKWGFAKTQATLSLTGRTPTGWNYEYYYPQGCVKALEIARSSLREKRIPFQTGLYYNETDGSESKVILTNAAGASLWFLRDVQNVAVFPPNFETALSFFMSPDLARVMSKNSKTSSEMFQLFQYHFNQAIMAGEAEAIDEKEADAEWITDR